MSSNGSAVGVIGDVVKGRSDLGLGMFIVNDHRYQHLDVGRRLLPACHTWAIAPGHLSKPRSVFTRAFTNHANEMFHAGSLCYDRAADPDPEFLVSRG